MLGRASCGFTLIEMLCALAIAGILSGIAYPSYAHVVYKVRRSEAQVALLAAQLAQERFRSDHSAYGTLADLRLTSTTSQGHYVLSVLSNTDAGFELLASAQGAQVADATCRHMKLAANSGTVTYASGPDANTANSASVNRQCWGI